VFAVTVTVTKNQLHTQLYLCLTLITVWPHAFGGWKWTRCSSSGSCSL